MDAQTNVTSTGQKIRTVDITVTAAMAALVCIYRRNLYLGTVSDGRIYKCIAGNSDPACSDPGPGRTFI